MGLDSTLEKVNLEPKLDLNIKIDENNKIKFEENNKIKSEENNEIQFEEKNNNIDLEIKKIVDKKETNIENLNEENEIKKEELEIINNDFFNYVTIIIKEYRIQ